MGKLKIENSGKLEKFWEKGDRKRRRKKKVNLELSLRELKKKQARIFRWLELYSILNVRHPLQTLI